MLRNVAVLAFSLVMLMGSAAAIGQTEAVGPKSTEAPSTDAERIVRLEQRVTAAEEELTGLKAAIEDPKSEYAQAKEEFATLDKSRNEKTAELKALQDAGKKSEADELAKELDAIEKSWQLAKERFDLAIAEDTARKAKITTLEKQIELDKEAIKRLQSPVVPQAASQPAAEAVEQKTESGEAAAGAGVTPGVPGTAVAPAQTEAGAAEEKPEEVKKAKPESEELIQAKDEANEAEAEATQAEETVKSLYERIRTLRKSIKSEEDLLKTARKKADNAREAQRTQSDLARKRSQEGAPREEVNELWAKEADARKRLEEARGDVTKHNNQLDAMRADLEALQSERIAALEDADQKRKQAEDAAKEVEKLENPFSVANMVQWVTDHGPPIAGILFGTVVMLWIAGFASKQIISLLAKHADHGTASERLDRAQTLASVFKNVARIAIVIGGILMILAEIDVNIVPLMGGVAVVGLAVAFGAQSLIKDYFYGFMILLENQYGINDVVKIGDTAGLVERITLRITVLRDLQGTLHFIPHGNATVVSNLTHGWSRAVFDIGVAYKEDVNRVIDILTELGKEMRAEPEFGSQMLDDPEMLGVDGFGDSAVTIKFIIKTKPLKQWGIKREMLRRIKMRFDQEGIEIPFPQRTIYYRNVEQPPGSDRG